MPETIIGQIERVTYHRPEDGFAVLRVRLRGQRDLVTVVGKLTSVTPGEHLEATGQWVVDRDHGKQFRADDLRTAHPASAEGIERYLASGAIRSIGPQLAKKIVSIYKERTLDVLDRSPDFLLHIRGIGRKRLKWIQQSWEEQKEVRQIMLFLAEHGVGSGRAVRIYRTYGREAIALIKENPYRLAGEIRGIGFKSADQLASRLGIPADSPRRMEAAVRHTLQQLAEEGHCACPQLEVVRKTAELVEVSEERIAAVVEHSVADGSLVREAIDGTDWLYLPWLYHAEVGLAKAIRRLAAHPEHPLPRIEVAKAIGWVEARLGLRLAAGQREAIRQACCHKVLVITGGPGVGKTTLVRSLIEIFEAKGLRPVLAVPTGRAAKRLAETTGRTAKTLHRLMEFDPASGGFRRDAEHPLAGDLLVLDETSMVDAVLAYQFLRALPPRACLVLVGDADQLPSVGPGAVLADLISSRAVPVVRLTEIFRQARQSRIVTAAYAINAGRLPDLEPPEALSDFYFIPCDRPEDILGIIQRLVDERIPDRFSCDPRTDVQVLTPMNRSLLGTRHLNQLLQQTLNPDRGQPWVERYGWTFREGDRVIQLENDYRRDVFNGELGVVEKINRIDQQVIVSFDGRRVEYDLGDLDELALAYALSIHKSQGSEYPCVVIPLHTQHYPMLKRNLLYTAVTRGKRLVVIVGSEKALRMCVRRPDTARRFTALRRRLAMP
ncbi:MAG TPA: ATP-dependent RecD-like DNA helicase [Planctomycetes bacterium]|nr:ATP-dependent RecD-like DNA helicase [Planctomycetota bacterium]